MGGGVGRRARGLGSGGRRSGRSAQPRDLPQRSLSVLLSRFHGKGSVQLLQQQLVVGRVDVAGAAAPAELRSGVRQSV